MKRLFIILAIILTTLNCSKPADQSEVKSLLIEQLQNTHNHQNWFLPSKMALEGLNYDQAIWKDTTDNNSIIGIVSHMIFWHERVLKAFNGEDIADFIEDNKETFINNDSDWNQVVAQLDRIQTEWEQLVENATDEQLKEWGGEIANMIGHTAYHTGQIIYIRKRNGWWK